MPRKISHVFIAIAVLAFCIGGFSLIINFGDMGSGTQSSEYIIGTFSNLDNNLSDFKNLEYELNQKMANTSDLEPSSSSQVENRGSSSFGLIDLLSKNILIGFINEVGKALGAPVIIISFLISIISGTILILFIRAYWGSDRI